MSIYLTILLAVPTFAFSPTETQAPEIQQTQDQPKESSNLAEEGSNEEDTPTPQDDTEQPDQTTPAPEPSTEPEDETQEDEPPEDQEDAPSVTPEQEATEQATIKEEQQDPDTNREQVSKEELRKRFLELDTANPEPNAEGSALKDTSVRLRSGGATNLIQNDTFSDTSYWTQLIWNGSSWDSTTGLIGSGVAGLTNGSMKSLVSNVFTIPQNVTDLHISYDVTFTYNEPVDGCTGANGVGFYLVDLNSDYSDLISFYDISIHNQITTFTKKNSSFESELGFTNIEALQEKEMYIYYLTLNDDPSCSFTFQTDNVFLTALTDAYAPIKIYRFWSNNLQGHFYTGSATERNHIIDTYDTDTWGYEGSAYYAYGIQAANTTPVYRFWSDTNQGHFYTANVEERDIVITNYDDRVWRYEGVAFYVYPLTYTTGTKTVYRFWSDANQHHFYTANATERDQVIANYDDYIWRYEGGAWNVPNM